VRADLIRVRIQWSIFAPCFWYCQADGETLLTAFFFLSLFRWLAKALTVGLELELEWERTQYLLQLLPDQATYIGNTQPKFVDYVQPKALPPIRPPRLCKGAVRKENKIYLAYLLVTY